MKFKFLILFIVLNPIYNKIFGQSHKSWEEKKNEIELLFKSGNLEESHFLAEKYKMLYTYFWIVKETIDSCVLINNYDKALFYAEKNNLLKHLDESLEKSISNLKNKKLLDSALVSSCKYNNTISQYLGTNNYYCAKSYLYIGNCYESINKNDSAIINWTNAVDFLISNSFKDSFTADILVKIGNCFAKMHIYSNAVHYLKQSIEIQEKSMKTTSNFYANSLMTYGEYLKLANIDIELSDNIVYKAIIGKVKNLIKVQPFFADSLNYIVANRNIIKNTENIKLLKSIADYLLENGETTYSTYFYERAISLLKYTEKLDSGLYANCLSSYGYAIYHGIFDFYKADTILKQAIKIQKLIKGELNSEYAESLNMLGSINMDYGNYSIAGQYLSQSLEIKGYIMKKHNPEYIQSLVAMGEYYHEVGNLKKAIHFFEQAQLYGRETNYAKTSDYAWTLVLLSRTYRDEIKKSDSSKKYLQKTEWFLNEALNIVSKLEPNIKNHYKPKILNDLGNLYQFDLYNYKLSYNKYKEALSILKSNLREKSLDYAIISTNLGSLIYKKDPWLASGYAMNALEFLDSYDGGLPQSENTLFLLGAIQLDFSYLWRKYNRKSKSYDYDEDLLFDVEYYYGRALEMHNLMLHKKLSGLSENERVNYWTNNELSFYNKFISHISYEYANNMSLKILQGINYNLICASKSLLLEASNLTNNIIAESKDMKINKEYRDMQHFRRCYSKMLSNRDENRILMLQYKSMADSLDKTIAGKLVNYAATKKKFNLKWGNIKDSLQNSHAAVEFTRYYDYKDTIYKYMALVVRPGYNYPKPILLASEDSIRKAIKTKNFSVLYNHVWKDIDTLLNGVSTIYYSPAGELNNVAFSALCYNNGQSNSTCNTYLLDKYSLHQLTTTRYLADGTLKKSKPLRAEIALFGGINYDVIPKNDNSLDTNQSNESYVFEINLEKQKQISGNRNTTYSMGMPYLEGTKIEVGCIGALMNENKWKVETKTDTMASEHSLKKFLQEHNPGVLHIATHGFAFAEKVKKENRETIMMGNKSNYRVSEDPMIRCGLMLGGSNISWTGQIQKMVHETGEDGILTAAEVANMDLRGTKLAVLSACETGLGQIESTEGTFGLKRGFKLAGVEQIIVSLWSVPDKETMEMMNLFYADLAITGDPVISFEKSQKAMRDRYPSQPSKWAGFVLVR